MHSYLFFFSFIYFLFGGLYLYSAKSKRASFFHIFVSIACFVLGIMGIAGSLANIKILMETSYILGVALLLIFISLSAFYSIRKCTVPIQASYVKCEIRSVYRNSKSYMPVFRYDYKGITYENQTMISYSIRKITENLEPGRTYQIYIDPDSPELCVIKRRPTPGFCVLMLMGVLLVFLYLYYIFTHYVLL